MSLFASLAHINLWERSANFKVTNNHSSDQNRALGALYEEAGFLVYRRCVQMLGDPQEAMDVTQWSFVRALEIGLEPEPRGRAIKWLYVTAGHRCLTLLRNGRTRRRIGDACADDILPLPPPPADAVCISRDLLQRVLERVDERTAEVGLLTWGQGLTNHRVAELLGTSVRTVIRARKRLEAELEALHVEVP